jgi:hypothetical protein
MTPWEILNLSAQITALIVIFTGVRKIERLKRSISDMARVYTNLANHFYDKEDADKIVAALEKATAACNKPNYRQKQ